MNDHLPDGIQILNCQLRSEAKKERALQAQRFSIQVNNQDLDFKILDAFKNSVTWPYERTNHKGRRHYIDLKSAVQHIILRGKNTLVYDTAAQSQHTIRPTDIMVGIFKMPVDALRGAKVVKLDPLSDKSAVDNDTPNS
jgi:hypothetical protein